MYCYKPLFRSIGKNSIFNPYSIFSFENITVGNDVYIGPGATFLCTESEIILGNKIMFGPNVSLIAGDHNSSVIGKYMFDVKKKLPENDLPIIIEDDVWVGAGATVLKGVTIGTGAIVAAGSVVVKNIPPYSICAGVPAKVLKKRFTSEDLETHIKMIKENKK